MSDSRKLDRPWLIAVWPGMGHVALSAGYYLMSKLGMHQRAEFSAEGLFDVDAAMVKDGLVLKPHRPRSRLFGWEAPEGKRDVFVFIGEAQPTLGKYAFCEQLIDFARDQGVERIFTFAALATEMQPGQPGRVFVAATEQALLDEFSKDQVHWLEQGQVGGLNGVLLAAAAEKGMPGACLLGEMPHLFAQMLYPKASLAVLNVFTRLAGVELDMAELARHAEETEHRLGELLAKLQEKIRETTSPDDEDSIVPGDEWKEETGISPEDEQRIESLFREASTDRSRAFELKSELDRLGLFEEYEDRFLDLFKQDDSESA